MELRLGGIVLALRQVGVEEPGAAADRDVVADRAEPAQHLVHDFLALDPVLHREADVVVREGRGVRAHVGGVVLGAGDVDQREPVGSAQAPRGVHVGRADRIERPGQEAAGARRGVRHVEHFDRIEVALIVAVEIRELPAREPHPGLERLQGVGSGADAGVPVLDPFLSGDQPDRGQMRRQVEVDLALLHDDGVRPVGAQLLEVPDDLLALGEPAVLARVLLQRPDHVGGGQGLAVVELHPPAQLERPGPVRRAFPALRQARLRGAVAVDLDQRVVAGQGRQHAVVPADHLQRVERVAAGAAVDPDTQRTPFLRRRGLDLGPHRSGQRYGHAGRGRGLHELPPGHPGRERPGLQGGHCS